MGTTATKKGGDFEITPAGPHVARCYRVIDLGTQTTEYMGEKKRAHKIMLSWELLSEQRMADGRPFAISKRYTVSTHEKSTLRKDLEAWRGRAFTREEESAFDVVNVLGAYCLLNVTHNQGGDGNTYANVGGLMPVPRGMDKPSPVNPNQSFDIDKPDMALFDTFSDKLKATIMAAPEWHNGANKNDKGDAFEDDISWKNDAAAADEPLPF